ncbi:MAG: hypothetical protein K2Q24_11615 [Chitinophagaceae bacterium]|nr:hypothetical protein [Chitinophagaceae bacterium]
MRYILVLAFFLMMYSASAQIFGGNPPSVKFFQLTTDTVRVIFPKALEKQAREVVWLSHQLAKNDPASLGNKLRRFDIVLQNQTTSSNAYVGPAPWRSEFFMMPDLANLSGSSIPWHQSLAVHEFRHIQQFSNFNKVIPRTAGIFLGQEGQAVAMGAVIPDWFWEGDAVWNETITTQQGRGRLPDFFNAYRSLWLEKKNYSYQKLRNGSYRHFVPNHYDLGYLLVSYGREKYGTDFWKKVTGSALDYDGIFYPFQKAVKKYSGVKYKTFVRNAFSFYKSEMAIDQSSAYQTLQPITKPDKNNVVSYQYPFVQNDGSLLLLKSSYKQIPSWTSIAADGTEKRIRTKDIADDDYYSFRNGHLVYTAYEPDARWGWRDYSVVKIWNVSSNEVKKISSKSRLFMPDITADGQTVVASYSGTDQQAALQLINTADETVTQLSNPNQYIYTYPKFTADAAHVISAVRNQKGEMALLQTSVSNGEETILIPFSNTTIGYVQVEGDTILFSASQKQGDVLFLFNRKSNEIYKVAQLPNGNYQAVIDQKTNSIIWNTFSTDGRMLLKQPLNGMKLQRVENLETVPALYLSAKTFSFPDQLQNVQQQPGEVKRYKPAFKLLNIHSWRPKTLEPDYGITFFSDNVLNTFTGEYSYNYNRNEGFHQVAANMVYGGWFPFVSVGVAQTWNRSDRLNNDTTITWNQLNANAGITVPLNLTSGTMYKNLTFAASLNSEQLSYTGLAKTFIRDETFNYINTSVRWLSQSQRARQHIFPRWAQSMSLQYRRTVNGNFGNQMTAGAGLYFPGIAKSHNLVLLASWFARDTIRGSKFTNSFPFARGYNAINFPRMWRLSANYHFPIVHPEFGIGNIVYFLRVRANAFYDYTKGRSLRTGRVFPLRTAGTEIYFDTRIWNTFFASFGIRYSRLLDTDLLDRRRNANQFEFILPVDLF